MNNILDYVKWRGDIPLTMIHFNEVDGLILSELSYLFWERALSAGEFKKLECVYYEIKDTNYTRTISADEDKQLLELCASSNRFGDIVVCNYVTEIDEKEGKQFAAITFCLPDESIYVAFRGTDGTIVGWEEDCNLAFSDPIPAQIRSVEYLRHIAHKTTGKIRIGGHSKGGNLAIYAAATIYNEIQDRLDAVYGFDAPGLSDRIDASLLYSKIESVLFAFVPKSSLIGMLLQHSKKYYVVDSDSIGVFQHNPYCWHVRANGFEYTTQSKDSEFIEQVMKKWLENVEDIDRRILIDAFFRVVAATNAKAFNREVLFRLYQNPLLVTKTLQELSVEDRKKVMRKISDLLNTVFKEATTREQFALKALVMPDNKA